MTESSPVSPVNPGISLIVPVYNEAEGLPAFLSDIQQVIESLPYPVEVTLVDDGSDDGTPGILRGQPYPMIRHEENRGYGAAIKTGLEHSRGEAVVIIDSDGTYRLEEILAVIRRLEEYDMVVGARLGPQARIPWTRRPAKWLIRQFAGWMVRRPIPDLNSGLRAVRRAPLEKIHKLLPDGFSLTTTITVAFLSMGKRVYFHPIQYQKRTGKSKFHPIRDTWNMILVILRTVVLLRPLNVFLPISFTLGLLALAVLLFSKWLTGQFMDATFIVLAMAGAQMFVLGLIADLIVRINLWTH